MIKLLFILVIAVAGTLWLSPELRSKAIVYMKDMGMEELLKNAGMEGVFPNTGVEDKSVTFYKWQDENGVWQYTQFKPANSIEYDKVETQSDVNILPSIKQQRTEEK